MFRFAWIASKFCSDFGMISAALWRSPYPVKKNCLKQEMVHVLSIVTGSFTRITLIYLIIDLDLLVWDLREVQSDLVDDAAEAPDVALSVVLAPVADLGRQVDRRPDAGARHLAGAVQHLGHAEVAQLELCVRSTVQQEDVARFHIAVQNLQL